jgi:5-methylcytosine-specific restriction protein A
MPTAPTVFGGVQLPKAPKICFSPGCRALVKDGGSGCPEHRRTWTKPFDKRRSDTKEHRALRARVFARDHYSCRIKYAGICTGRAEILDRVDRHGDYTDDNCWSGCRPCHLRKTALEGNQAKGHRVVGLPSPTQSEDVVAQPAERDDSRRIPRRIETVVHYDDR